MCLESLFLPLILSTFIPCIWLISFRVPLASWAPHIKSSHIFWCIWSSRGSFYRSAACISKWPSLNEFWDCPSLFCSRRLFIFSFTCDESMHHFIWLVLHHLSINFLCVCVCENLWMFWQNVAITSMWKMDLMWEIYNTLKTASQFLLGVNDVWASSTQKHGLYICTYTDLTHV